MIQWEFTLHDHVAAVLDQLDALTPAKVYGKSRVPAAVKPALEASIEAAKGLVKAQAAGDEYVEVYFDGSAECWAMVKVLKRGDAPDE